MTPIPTQPPSPLLPLHLHQRPDLPTVHRLISSLNRCIASFLSDPSARNALRSKCKAKLSITNLRNFEFFEHSVLSNLYWGMENVELAVQSGSPEEKERRLANAERMLQAPAALDEDGTMAGVLNRYLVCCAYFYLAAVRRLRGDDCKAAMHLLQCLLVSPRWFREELEVEPWMGLFRTLAVEGGEESKDEILRQNARRCKDWLMYYQIVYYGDNPSSLEKGTRKVLSSRCVDSAEESSPWSMSLDAKFVYQLDLQERTKGDTFAKLENGKALLKDFNDSSLPDIKEVFDMRCLQQMLEDSQSDTTISYSHIDSMEPTDLEEQLQFEESSTETLSGNAVLLSSKTDDRNVHGSRNSPMHHEANKVHASFVVSNALDGSLNTVSFPVLSLRDVDSHHFSKCYAEDLIHPGRSPAREIRCFSSFSSKFLKRCSLPEFVPRGSFARRRINFTNSEKALSEESSSYEKDTQVELLGRFEKAVAMLCFSESKCEDAGLEVTTVWEILNNKPEVNYRPLKQVILHQLLEIISTSKRENFIRASVSTLLVLVSEDKTVIEDIRKKEKHLYDLASALKRNIHEAAILIYLLNPSPSEIKSLELLPALVEVACNSNSEKCGSKALQLTPTSASILMIESLVTAFDYVTNNMNLTLISSPQTLSKLVTVAKSKNLDEIVALAAILVRCMHLDGKCRKFLAQVPSLDPFLNLLNSNEKRAKLAALEYFYELLRMPRSSAIHLLHRMHQHGVINFMQTSMECMQQAELEHQLLAVNLLLQLDMMGRTGGKSEHREEAMGILLKAVASEENPNSQALSASILSNLGGTYSWTGESHTSAWLLRKAGLTSVDQRNMIRNTDWLDPCLQENELDAWNGKVARSVIRIGSCVFDALAKGIESKTRGVSHDCLITIAWLGSEMAVNGPSSLRYSACEILLTKIAGFLHPGSELDERVLACLCVYNYTSGKGKQKLMNFSEGSRESLRRLSGITWMAEELLKVTDYFLPTKSRISCVHTQILEIGHVCNVAATALIFYKGHLCSGYADGSIKVWDIKGQRAMLVWEIKEHKKPVTCFTIFGQGDKLLSGSSDKTIRVWKMEQKKLECVEVIQLKEAVLKMDTHGDKILFVTQKSGLKVHHASSSSIQIVCKSKQLKCLAVAQNKVYLGCADSSVQEVDIKENHKTEIRAPTNSWRMLNKPINSVSVYKDWIYCAGTSVEGSSIKEWRRKSKPQLSIAMGRGTSVQAMAVVEDFIYLNCTSSPTIIQIWLREKQQKVSRLSAGSKITCLLTANDVVFCGTESGLIKGWIPL